jgi:hypothetical protein
MRQVIRTFALVTIVALSTSCGDVVRQGRAPMILILNSLQGAQGNHPGTLGATLFSDVVTNVTSPPPCSTTSPCPTIFGDVGSAVISLAMKDSVITPSTNNSVTITRYHVAFTRADGRNQPGVDVPFGFDGAVTATIVGNAQTTLGFELVRHDAKMEAPLVQLVVNTNIITTIATVTFFGKDLVGNDISVTGTMTIEFGNFGDT